MYKIKVLDVVSVSDSFSNMTVSDRFWRVIAQTDIEDPVAIASGGMFKLVSIPKKFTIMATGDHITVWKPVREDGENPPKSLVCGIKSP